MQETGSTVSCGSVKDFQKCVVMGRCSRNAPENKRKDLDAEKRIAAPSFVSGMKFSVKSASLSGTLTDTGHQYNAYWPSIHNSRYIPYIPYALSQVLRLLL